MVKELEQKITNLTAEWYQLIGSDHHKDRDCHWYIRTSWSYGGSPVYVIEHRGYILDEIYETWGSYELACIRLKELLTAAIANEKNEQAAPPEE
jgi:hypothetical protein